MWSPLSSHTLLKLCDSVCSSVKWTAIYKSGDYGISLVGHIQPLCKETEWNRLE